jgi:hypothetical protein
VAATSTSEIVARPGPRIGAGDDENPSPRRVGATRGTVTGAGLAWAIGGLLGTLGIALRVLTTVGYWPGYISHPDTGSYVAAAAHSLFSDPFRPAGYAFFLRLMHGLSRDLSVTIAVQHLIGLATAVLAYRICRRIGAQRGVSLVPAAAVLLSGDQLFLEYSLLSDALFLVMVLLACALALAIPASKEKLSWTCLLAAALMTALTATVRTVGVALVPVLILWLVVYGEGAKSLRLRRAGAVTIVCLAVLVGYAGAQQHATGVFGLTRFGAWPLYARVAPIADCHRFTPPAHTSSLCDQTPVSQRPGPDYYLWNPYSPAERTLGYPPSHASAVAAFARATIVHEPLSYLAVVGRDLGRYIDPSLVTAPQWGEDASSMALNQPWNTPVAFGVHEVSRYYGNVQVRERPGLLNALEAWRRVFRLHGVLIALCALLTAAGLLSAPDRRTSRGIALLGAFALVLFVVPTATMSYEARYGVPGSLLLVISGARGGEVALARLRRADWWRRARTASAKRTQRSRRTGSSVTCGR